MLSTLCAGDMALLCACVVECGLIHVERGICICTPTS